MPNFIDRRLNPKDKSLGNRQRFLRRAREELKRSIRDQVNAGKIADVDAEHTVAMPVGGTSEPSFENAERQRPARPRPAGQQAVCAGRPHPEAGPGRRRRLGLDAARVRGRFPLRAVARGIPRSVLRGSGASRHGQAQSEGDRRLQATPGRLHHDRLPDQHQCRPHHAQLPWPPHRAEAAEAARAGRDCRRDRDA